MIFPINLIENGGDLTIIVSFDFGDASSLRRQANFGGEKVIHALSRRSIQELIRWMLIRPSSAPTGLLNDFEDVVHTDIVVRINRSATLCGIQRQLPRIDSASVWRVGIIVDGAVVHHRSANRGAFGAGRRQAAIVAIFKNHSCRKRGTSRHDCKQSWP